MVHKIKTKVFLKIFSIFLFVLLLGAYASTFALFNGNPYAPGSTLDPECAPTDTNCKVLLTSGGSSPWLTGTSNIYHNGNVNVGSDTASINTSIGGGSGLQNIYTQNLSVSSIPNYAIAMELNNGNPVMAWYSTSDAFYGGGMEFNFISKAYASTTGVTLIICSDPECSEATAVSFDSDYQSQGQAPIVKIGSDGFIRMAYLGINQSVMYVKCNDAICSDPYVTTPREFEGENSIKMSLSLDNNDNPYIVFSSNDGNGTFPYLSRYIEADDSWTNSLINYESYLGLGIGSYFGNGISGIGDYSYIDNDGHLNFVGAIPFGDYNYILSLFTCSDVDCTSYTTSPIDQSYIFNSFLGKDSEGNPIVAYALGDNSTGQTFLKLATYVGDGTGTGCDNNINNEENYSSNWNCQIIKEYSNNEELMIEDIEVGSDNNARITYNVYADNQPYYNTATLTKCLNTTCSSSEDTEIYNLDETDDRYYASLLSIALDSNDMAYLAYGYLNQDFDSYSLKIDKEIVSESVSFNPNGNDFFTFGDVGIKNNLFVDGSIVTPNGIYLNNGTPDNTFNALYNVGGDLYWNGSSIGGGSVSVGPDLVLGEAGVTSGSLTINTSASSDLGYGISLFNYYDYCSSHDILCPHPYTENFSLYLPAESGVLATQDYVLNNSSSPITIVNSTNLFSTGLTGTGSGLIDSTIENSNFFGVNAGYYATHAYSSNFFGINAGYSATYASNSNFFGDGAGYNVVGGGNELGFNSNFLGYNTGYYATSASGSNFLGLNAGYYATYASNSNFFGSNAGSGADNAANSNFLGPNAGKFATYASNSNFLGNNAGYNAPNASNSIFIGQFAGSGDLVDNTTNLNDFSILIGQSTSTGGFKNSIAIGGSATNTATNQFMIGSTNRPINTTVWKGTSVTATLDTATGLITTSDERLKTNIHILSNNTDYYSSGTTEDIDEEEISIDDMTTLEKVISIIPVRYDWREDSNDDYNYTDTTPKNIGFIAQDLQKYFPEVVYTGVDENHYLGVNYANMTPILVEAIKEMNLIVKDLSSLDTESATSLGSLIKNFLEDQAILINELTVNRLNISGDVCVDDVCITKEQFKEMLINAGSDDYVSGTPESE